MRRVSLIITIVALGLSVIVPTSMAAARGNVTATSAPAASTWSQCWRVSDHRTVCHRVKWRQTTSRLIGYRDSISNGRNYAINGSCQASTSKTSTYSLGVEATTEMKAAIFGGMEITVSANLSKSMSTGFVTSASFKVPAHDTVYCDRGIVNERVRMVKLVKSPYCCNTYSRTAYTAKAPKRARWWIY